MENRVFRIERRDWRGLVRHPVVRPGDGHRIRGEAPVDERVLLVLHDDEAAPPGVVEQPAVRRDQRGLGLVGAAPDDDRVVAGQVAPGDGVRGEEIDRHTDRLQRLGDPVGRAAHVADAREPGEREPRRAQLRHRRTLHGPRPDVGVVDHDERALRQPTVGSSGGRAELECARPHAAGQRERDGEAACLVFPLEGEALRREAGPTRGRRRHDLGAGGAAAAVRHGEREAARPAPGAARRPHHEARAHRDIEGTRDEEWAPHLADRLIAEAIHDFAGQRHGRSRDHDTRRRREQGRLEREPTPGGGHAGPVVQGARERTAQEVGLRARGVRGHGDGEAARRDRPGGDG